MNNSELCKALRQAVSEEFADIPKECEIKYEFSDSFKSKMDLLFKSINGNITSIEHIKTKPRRIKKRALIAAAIIAFLIFAFSATAFISEIIPPPIITYENCIIFNDKKYFRYDKYGNDYNFGYKLLSSFNDDKNIAYTTNMDSEVYEIKVHTYVDDRYISDFGSILFEPMIYASEEIVNMPFLEDYSLCEKITVEIAVPRFPNSSSAFVKPFYKEKEFELTPELQKALFDTIYLMEFGEYLTYYEQNEDKIVETVCIYPKGTDSRLNMCVLTRDVEGRIGLFRNDLKFNRVLLLTDGFSDPDKFFESIIGYKGG